LALTVSGRAEEKGWIDLTSGNNPLEAYDKPGEGWMLADSVEMSADNPRRLTAKEGRGILVNSPKGRAKDLITKQKFTDVEVHVEFLIPKGSNSGVKLMGLYEIQIMDTHDAKKLSGDSCGGIYPRAENAPRYHHIDEGVAPKVNAAKPAGEWQTLDIVFLAPRFNDIGKKTANGRFVQVVLNGQVVHENVEVEYPTGAAWRLKKEVASGPLLLQGDHGPVAFRNVRIRARPMETPTDGK
jgi:hypothetical protein